jgi:phage terminase Nu1 subunit (DNA packaging protein)
MKVTYNQLSELTGMTYRTIKKRIDGLDPVGVTRNNANQWESREALQMIYGVAGADKDNKLDAQQEKAKLDKERRITQRLKNRQLEGELIHVDQIRDQWQRIVVAIRTQFMALPNRLSQMLETVSTPRERRQMIEDEVKIILNGLADGEGQ